MGSARPGRLADPASGNISPNDAPKNMSLQANKPNCGCNCGCMCCGKDTNDNSQCSLVSTPMRGRSLTAKYDRTNGAGNSIEARPAPGDIDLLSSNTTPSVDGQEGLQTHQIEHSTPTAIDDTAARANDSVERWLAEYNSERSYRFPDSADHSMIVEASTVAPSSASSGFLPPRTATSDDLTTFTGGFDEPKGQTCAFTPLWLTHELRYCRNFQRGDVVGSFSKYPVTIDVDDLLG
jgi:hypothetical protein